MVFPAFHAFCLDTIEETYNMDPPLSIYPKKSPYTTYYYGFLLGSLPCNLPRYRVPLTEVYRVTLHGRITDDQSASAQLTGKLRVSIKENGSTWEGKNEIRSDQRTAISIKKLLVWERKRCPPPIYCQDSAGSDQQRTSTSRGFDINVD